MKLNDHYHDRGIVKYRGFFLSEHTRELKDVDTAISKFNPPKEYMEPEEISEVLSFAALKDLPVAVQLNFTIGDDHGFPDDIVGKISAYDNQRILISGNNIQFDLIRNVETTKLEKWF